MTAPRDYLAIIIIGPGGGSYYRAADPATAALKAAKQARKDWSRLYSIPKGHVWTVPVYDVTGHDDVTWDDRGVFDTATGEQITRHSLERPTA